MSETLENIEISGEMVASPQRTETRFEESNIHLNTTSNKPLLLIFSAKYRWAGQDEKLNDWDFYMTISDEKGEIIHSDYKHFGEDEPGLIGRDEKSYREYLKEESYLKYYKDNHRPRSGEGTMVRSLKTPSSKGRYVYRVKLTAQFWARSLGEKRGVEKNKSESIGRCTVELRVD